MNKNIENNFSRVQGTVEKYLKFNTCIPEIRGGRIGGKKSQINNEHKQHHLGREQKFSYAQKLDKLKKNIYKENHTYIYHSKTDRNREEYPKNIQRKTSYYVQLNIN